MSDDIECAFTGRLTADPVPRTSKTGKAWLPLSLAVGPGDAVQFVNAALFGDSVPEMAGRLHKGDRVYVEGRLQLRTWTDKDGRERAGLSVSSFHVVPLGQIGRRRPGKPKASGARPQSPETPSDLRPSEQLDPAVRRDWQSPPSGPDAEIPF